MFTEKIEAFIAEQNLIKKQESLGVAVSGGADSMALLYALHARNYRVTALHFEHGIRGGESLRDLHFVETFCQQHNIPFACEQADVPALARKGESIEAAARRLRYAFFARACRTHRLDKIATAHHMDDACETFLFHLLRGGGMQGLLGIPVCRGNIVRPLLCVTRKEIETYVAEQHIPHVTDSTNTSEDYTRNYIRKTVLPTFLHINPRYLEAICRAQDLLREEDAALSAYAQQEYARLRRPEEDAVSLDITAFNALPLSMRRRVLRLAIAEICSLQDVEKQHIDAILSLCAQAHTGKHFALPQKFFAVISYNSLIIAKKLYKIIKYGSFSIGIPGNTQVPGGTLVCERAAQRAACQPQSLVQFMDADSLKGAVLRTRQRGDVIHPLGMEGHKSLSDWMIDRKIPVSLRDGLPLLAKDGEILWAIGYGISDSVKVKENTSSIIKLTYLPDKGPL